MNKKGFIFDLDGVIVDTAKYHYLAWKKLANELGFEFTKEQNELFKGVSRKRCLEILLHDIGFTVSMDNHELEGAKEEIRHTLHLHKLEGSDLRQHYEGKLQRVHLEHRKDKEIFLVEY